MQTWAPGTPSHAAAAVMSCTAWWTASAALQPGKSVTLQGLVESLDGKDQTKDKEARGMQAGHEKGGQQCQEGMRPGRGYWCHGRMRTGLSVLVLQERHQVGGQKVAGLNLELLNISSPWQAGRIGRIPLQDRVTFRLYSCPLTCQCDPQKAPASTGSSPCTMISKGVMLKNKKDWQVPTERLGLTSARVASMSSSFPLMYSLYGHITPFQS